MILPNTGHRASFLLATSLADHISCQNGKTSAPRLRRLSLGYSWITDRLCGFRSGSARKISYYWPG